MFQTFYISFKKWFKSTLTLPLKQLGESKYLKSVKNFPFKHEIYQTDAEMLILHQIIGLYFINSRHIFIAYNLFNFY